MANAPTSERDQTALREQDRVFNDETCRALRKKGYDAAQVIVPLFTVLVFCFAAALQGVVSILGPWMELLVGLGLSLVFTVTLIAELRWFGVSFYRETLREMKQDLMREARRFAGDSEAIESRALAENNEPDARPELAFGLSPEDCLLAFGMPVAGLFVASSMTNLTASVLLLGGSSILGAVLFVDAKRSDMNTYPPENPPHDRHREHTDEESVRGYQ
jgi:hypothetical protein